MRFFHRPQQQYHLALCTGLQAIAARSGVDLSNPRKVWRKRPSSTRKRARCVASGRRKRNTCAMSVSRVTSPGHASAKARSKANRIGRLASDTVVLTACTKWRQASITRTDEAKRLSMSSSSSGHESVLLFLLWSCAMGVLRNSCVLATSRLQRGNAGSNCGFRGGSERLLCGAGLQTPQRDACQGECVNGTQGRWQGRGIELFQFTFGFGETADQREPPNFEQLCVTCVDDVAVGFEYGARRAQGLGRPLQVAWRVPLPLPPPHSVHAPRLHVDRRRGQRAATTFSPTPDHPSARVRCRAWRVWVHRRAGPRA